MLIFRVVCEKIHYSLDLATETRQRFSSFACSGELLLTDKSDKINKVGKSYHKPRQMSFSRVGNTQRTREQFRCLYWSRGKDSRPTHLRGLK